MSQLKSCLILLCVSLKLSYARPQEFVTDAQSLNFSNVAPTAIITAERFLSLNPTNLSDTLLIVAEIQDTAGTNLNEKISLQLHTTSKRSLAVTKHRPKRNSYARIINTACPIGTRFFLSYCVRSPGASLKTYRVMCEIYPAQTYGQSPLKAFSRSCNEDEYCTNNYQKSQYPVDRNTRAYCAKHGSNVNMILADQNAGTTVTYNAARSGRFGVDAVLAGPDGETSLFAKNMSIHAQNYHTFPNQELWGSLPDGDNQCNNCGDIDISPIPAGTKRIKVGVILPIGVEAGSLLMTLVDLNG